MTHKNIPCITAHWELISEFFTDKSEQVLNMFIVDSQRAWFTKMYYCILRTYFYLY